MMPAAGTFERQQLVEGAAALERAADLQRFELQRQRRGDAERAGRQLDHRRAADMRSDEAPGGLDFVAADHVRARQAATWRRKWSKSGVVARGSLAASS